MLGGSLQGEFVTGEVRSPKRTVAFSRSSFILMYVPCFWNQGITSTAWHDEADAYIAANAAQAAAFPWPPAATLVVAARDVGTFTMEVNAGETARWEWDIESYDISFKVSFTPQGSSDAVAVSEALRCEAGLARWIGEYTPVVQERGTLELQWDNTSSLLRSKKIRYRAAAAVLDAGEAAAAQ